MAPIDLFNAGLPQNFCLYKKSVYVKAIKQRAIKQDALTSFLILLAKQAGQKSMNYVGSGHYNLITKLT